MAFKYFEKFSLQNSPLCLLTACCFRELSE